MRINRRNVVASCLLTACIACSSKPTFTGARIGGDRPMQPNAQTAAPGAGLPGAAAAGTGAGATSNNPLIVQTSKAMFGGVDDQGLKAGQCAKQNIVTMRVHPTVWLVLDGSGSMVETLGDTSRWNALRSALMDPNDGVVKSLQHDVDWGMVIYDGMTPGDIQEPLPDGGVAKFALEPAQTCPRVVSVDPLIDNFAALDMAYPGTPLGGSTPTDKALDAVIGHLPDMSNPMLDGKVNPVIVVLATDGAPNNFCTDDFTMLDVAPRVISVVAQLADMNIKTYVISLAGDDQNLTAHLQQVADAGKTGLPPFIPTNKAELVQTFQTIVGPAAACDVVLNGSVKTGIECMGTIKINGIALPCNDPNGWILKDPSTIEITGSACEKYRADLNAILEADFPCEVIDLN